MIIALLTLCVLASPGALLAQEPTEALQASVKALEAGLSAQKPDPRALEERAEAVEAVLDAVDDDDPAISEALREQAHQALERYEAWQQHLEPGGQGGADDEPDGEPGQAVRRLRRVSVPAEGKAAAAPGGEEAGVTTRVIRRVDAEDFEASAPGGGGGSADKAEEPVAEAPVPDKAQDEATFDPKERFVFAWPVKNVRVTSRYGIRRDPKNRRRKKMHKGLDLGGATGTPVLATGPGKIIRAGSSGGGVGIQIVIEHPGGWTSRYFHLSKVEVEAGTVVKRGQLIGRIGSTGRSTGPHLHFQIELRGHQIDPERVLGIGPDKAERRANDDIRARSKSR